jgi:hypothetical protein
MADAINPMGEVRGQEGLCGARTRAGAPCRKPKLRGRSRCRLHDSASGSGASGERNGRYKYGEHTKEAKGERRWVRGLVSAAEGKTPSMNDLPMPVTQSAPALYQPKRPKPVRAKVRPAANRTTRQVVGAYPRFSCRMGECAPRGVGHRVRPLRACQPPLVDGCYSTPGRICPDDQQPFSCARLCPRHGTRK